MGSSNSNSESTVSNTTNTVTDAYNQAYSRIENLSDVGNVSISGSGDGGPNLGLIFMLLAALVGGIFILRKKS